MNDSLKSAFSTALWTFLASVLVLATGWLASLAQWASTSGHSQLPGLSTIGYALVGAFVAAVAGLFSFVVRYLQSRGVFPGEPPKFQGGTPPE